MIKRTLYFGNPAKLQKQNEQLKVELKEDGEEHQVPIEDIGMLVLDDPRIYITPGLVNALLDNNATVLWCDERHLPKGLILPMATNHVYTEKLRSQLDASQPLQKQLWKQTVKQKVRNQGAFLKKLGLPADNMEHWAKEVKSGDPQNVEAKASAYYWKKTFEFLDVPNGVRDPSGPPPNNLLNYGYAVLRGVVARSLVASGCLPAVGIHHRNKYNPFCLADDIMEPFRPFVDRLVIELIKEEDEIPTDIHKELKKGLLRIPTLDVVIEEQKSPLMVGMQRTTASLMDCFEKTREKLLYPHL